MKVLRGWLSHDWRRRLTDDPVFDRDFDAEMEAEARAAAPRPRLPLHRGRPSAAAVSARRARSARAQGRAEGHAAGLAEAGRTSSPRAQAEALEALAPQIRRAAGDRTAHHATAGAADGAASRCRSARRSFPNSIAAALGRARPRPRSARALALALGSPRLRDPPFRRRRAAYGRELEAMAARAAGHAGRVEVAVRPGARRWRGPRRLGQTASWNTASSGSAPHPRPPCAQPRAADAGRSGRQTDGRRTIRPRDARTHGRRRGRNPRCADAGRGARATAAPQAATERRRAAGPQHQRDAQRRRSTCRSSWARAGCRSRSF